MKNILVLILIIFEIFSFYSQQLIPQGAQWKYKDDGIFPGASWNALSYDDSSWLAGNAELGFGDGDETTVLRSGHITYYFRHTFFVTDPNEQNNLLLRLLRDDGAVVYINGTEVVRSNMPEGTITSSTLASHTVSGTEEEIFHEFIISASYLSAGNNVIAVEVHQRSIESSDISFDLSLEFTSQNPPVFRKTPYLLYTGNNHEMLVVWQTYQSENCLFRWGTDTTYALGNVSIDEYGDDHQYKFLLTDLIPEQRYYYQISCDNSTRTGNFISGKNENSTSFTFYAYGDTRTYPHNHNSVARQILHALENDPSSQTFLINSGDLVSDGDNEADWDNEFFHISLEAIRSVTAQLPYLAAVGNHEGNGALFSKYFPYPMLEENTKYYSFDYANVHFTVLDQYDNYAQGSAQYNWLQQDLENTSKPWRVIIMHKPAWSAGTHENDYVTQTDLVPLFEQYGVSLVINGHNHYYAHALRNNIHYLTTGGGGAPLYSPDNSYPYITRTDRSYHFLKIRVIDNQNIFIEAIRNDGTLIESFGVNNRHVGVEDQQRLPFFITGGRHYIYVNNLGNQTHANILDMSGRIITSWQLKRGENLIPVKEGIYVITILLSTGNRYAQKVIVY